MGERTGYAPGTFCWAQLGTTDVAAALEFYGSLLGWDGERRPGHEDEAVTTLRMGELAVAGMAALPASAPDEGTPPSWRSFVNVQDVDAVAARAEELGGRIVVAPADVAGAARIAVVRDPQGAELGLWQAGGEIGARLVNDPGAMCLNQLNTHDPRAAAVFYRRLLGWKTTRVAAKGPPYWGIRNGGAVNGGMMGLPAEAPPHWLVYFTTEDVEDAAGGIRRLGGQVVVPPMSAGGDGRILVAVDPQGAFFALFEGRTDP